MEAFQDFEVKETCPFDNAHHIRSSRMAVHLVKCQKNHPDAPVAICDFNTLHVVPKPLLKYHHETCPDRKKIETFVLRTDEDEADKCFPVPNLRIESDENWDDEPECAAYDPKAYCERNSVLRHIDVAPSATRKNFRHEERLRLSQLKESQKAPVSNNSQRAVPAAPPHFGVNPSEQHENSDETNENHPKIEEEAPHLSLADRIKSGKNRAYAPDQ